MRVLKEFYDLLFVFFLFFNIDEIENIIGGVCGIFFLGIVVYLKFVIMIFIYLNLKEKF